MKKLCVFLSALELLIVGAPFAGAENTAPEFDYSSVIVMTYPQTAMIRMASNDDLFDGLGISRIENLDPVTNHKMSLAGLEPSKTLKLTLEEPGRENVLETVEKLRKLPGIRYAEPNYIFTLCDYPDDPEYISGSQSYLDLVSAPAVWDLNIDCSGVTVAIIDSGAMCEHQDLVDNIWTNPGEIPDNGIDDDGNGYIDDIHGWDFAENDNNPNDGVGHGTHVAGIVSARTNNGAGVASLARNAKIMPLRTFDSKGNIASFDIIYKAIAYAHSMGADIVNNSYATNNSAIEEETIQIFKTKIAECDNMLFIAAAGNSGTDNDTSPVYPAAYDLENVLTVANSTLSDTLYGKSNYGAQSVDIAAPGTSILSTYNNGGYSILSGTSMSCPLVAGAAAVVKAVQPELTPKETAGRLIDSADKEATFSGRVLSDGRLNVYAALPPGMTPMPTQAPIPTPTASPEPSPTVSPSPTPTVLPSPTVSPSANPIPTAPPSPEPAATVSPSPEPTATVSAEPIISNHLTAERNGDTVTVILNPASVRSDENIRLYAAVRGSGALTAVRAPKVRDMTATFEVPPGTENENITIYVWDNAMRPYTNAARLSDVIDNRSE